MCGLYVLRVGIPIRLVCDGSRPETVPWYGRLGAASRGAAFHGVATRHHARHLSTRACSTSNVLFSVLFNIVILSLPCHSQLTRAHAQSHTQTGDSRHTLRLTHSVSSHTQSPHDSKTTAAWPQIKPSASQPRVRGWRRPTVADGRIGRPPWSTRRAPRRPSTGTPVTTGSHDRGSTEEMSGRGNTHSPCATHEAARGSSC